MFPACGRFDLNHCFQSNVEAEIISFLLNKAAFFIFGILRPSYNFSKVVPQQNLINRTLRLGSRSEVLLSALYEYTIIFPVIYVKLCATFQPNGSHIESLSTASI